MSETENTDCLLTVQQAIGRNHYLRAFHVSSTDEIYVEVHREDESTVVSAYGDSLEDALRNLATNFRVLEEMSR